MCVCVCQTFCKLTFKDLLDYHCTQHTIIKVLEELTYKAGIKSTKTANLLSFHAAIYIRANWILAQLNMYSNTKRVFGCTVNDFSALLIAYLTSLMVFQ